MDLNLLTLVNYFSHYGSGLNRLYELRIKLTQILDDDVLDYYGIDIKSEFPSGCVMICLLIQSIFEYYFGIKFMFLKNIDINNIDYEINNNQIYLLNIDTSVESHSMLWIDKGDYVYFFSTYGGVYRYNAFIMKKDKFYYF